jgi:SAM-dependent methyltransferase
MEIETNYIVLLILAVLLFLLYSFFGGAVFSAPWVPTRKKHYEIIAKLADLKPGTTFYDLGSGSANMLFYFSKKYGINCVGIEISLFWYTYSKIKSIFYRKVDIKYGNLFKKNLSRADVVYVFLLPDCYDELKNKLFRELRPRSKIILSAWPFKDTKYEKRIFYKDTLPYYLYVKK